MELRFIERNGKRILQQQVEHYITPYNDLDKRFAWQDVPFAAPPDVWCGPYGEQSVTKMAAERDTLRALLNDAEERCERLEEKLKGKEKDAADWHKRYAALDKALLQRVGFRTRALVLDTADDIFPEL